MFHLPNTHVSEQSFGGGEFSNYKGNLDRFDQVFWPRSRVKMQQNDSLKLEII